MNAFAYATRYFYIELSFFEGVRLADREAGCALHKSSTAKEVSRRCDATSAEGQRWNVSFPLLRCKSAGGKKRGFF